METKKYYSGNHAKQAVTQLTACCATVGMPGNSTFQVTHHAGPCKIEEVNLRAAFPQPSPAAACLKKLCNIC